jgi:integrase/recombinase XerC
MERERDIAQFELYLQRRFPQRRTARDYVCDIKQFAAFCPKPWREVGVHDIDAFVDAQRATLQGATVRRRVAALKTFFDFLAEEHADSQWPNPVRFRRHAGKAAPRLPRDLSNEAVARLREQITSARDLAWFALLLRAGLRVGELVGLQRGDGLTAATAQEPARLRVRGKGDQERLVLLCAEAYSLLQEWLHTRPEPAETFIFVNDRDQPLTPSGVEWLLRGYAQQAHLSVTPHQLRHPFARQLTEAGMPITSLSKLLGHSQVSTTQIYTAGADPALQQAYQTVMNQLGHMTSEPVSAPTSPPAEAPRATAVPIPALPDWSSWEPNLPAALREATVAFVQHLVVGHPPQRRRQRAVKVLSAFRCFWRWQQERRPIRALSELTLRDLQTYQEQHAAQKLKPTTLNRTVQHVLGLLRYYREQGQTVDDSVFRLRLLPRGDPLPRALTTAASARLEQWLQERLATCSDPLARLPNACLLVLAHGGLRANECIELQHQDLDLAHRRLFVRQGKGQKDRLVCLSDSACRALQTYLDNCSHASSGLLWLRPDGTPINHTWLYLTVRKLAAAAGVPQVSPHRLRHTLATRLLNAGMDITRIQKLLGHVQINTTLLYARVSDATLESDYRRAMTTIEAHQSPLYDAPILAANWPRRDETSVPTQSPSLDNSV